MTGGQLWQIDIASPARGDLHRLPTKVAAAIVEFITGALTKNPLRLSKPLRNDLADYRCARRGDYRVLLRVDTATHAVLVVRIDHRAHAYRRAP